LADRDLDGERVGIESRTDFIEDTIEIRSLAIEFVDEHNARDAIFIGLSPNRLALRFDPFTGAENDDCTVEYSEAPFDFRGEIDVAGCIEQIDSAVLPAKGDASGEYRDAPLLFFGVIIGFGRTGVDGPSSVLGATHVEHLLGNGRLARIDVSNDADVANRL
jgi:hypothetical protein